MSTATEGLSKGRIGGRLWLYSNFHCSRSCRYCLTESSPGADPRLLGSERMLELAREAAELGFTGIGVTGGEPFLLEDMPELLARLAEVLPVLVLTNATLFNDALLARLRPLADLPVTLQVSLDSADARINDRRRGRGNFDAVVAAISRLKEIGLKVRLATTGGEADPEARARLCALHRRLGIGEEDHVVRPVLRRGRAADLDSGVECTVEALAPELTITAEGAFWSPFGPTIRQGKLDTDLLVSRSVAPLSKPVALMLGLLEGLPAGTDVTLNIQ
jgi:MoaA/NifB/PqqE/SkfB family radical SAM enzyme